MHAPKTLFGYPIVIDETLSTGEIRFGQPLIQQRRRGRPPLSPEPSERIDVRLPRSLYDALCRAALQADASLPDIVRDALDRFLSVKNRQA